MLSPKRAKSVRSDPAVVAQRWAKVVKRQPRLALASYVCALFGSLLAVHDYHHYNPNLFGLSTLFLGAALLLYLFSRARRPKLQPRATQPKR